MKHIRNTTLSTIFSLAALFLFGMSCEVGLGSSVDTEPPELEISSPASASIIRDTFALTGSWTDDGEIKKVSCELKNTENEKKKFTFDGQVTTIENGKGTWIVTVEKDSVPDGSYEASVTITDKADHETKAVRQIVIDNTSPVVVLKRPSSRKGAAASDIDGYGQVFTLKGLAADDSGVGLIEVNIYSDEDFTDLVKTVSIKNVPNTISLDVAQFEEGVENDYTAIYGSTDRTSGAKKRWCRVIAYDGAKRYPFDGSEQSEEDKKGNASTSYYLYEDISSSILNDYKITDLYAMKNGSYSGEEAAKRSVVSILDLNEISEGVFTLNPANNPKYTVSGYQELNKDGQDFESGSRHVKNGHSLNIDVKPGLDSYAIVQDSLKVYLQECDKDGKASGSSVLQEQAVISQNGTAYSITVPVSKEYGLKIGKTYLLTVTGNDEKGNPLVTEGQGYGFFLASNGLKPTLKVNYPESAAMVSKNASEDSITLEGTVFVPGETADGGQVIIKDSISNLQWTALSFSDTDTDKKTDTEQKWSITLNFKKNKTETLDSERKPYLPDGEHKFTIYALTDVEQENLEEAVNIERTVRVDTCKPEKPVLQLVKEQSHTSDKWYATTNLKVKLNAKDSLQNSYESGLLHTQYYKVPEDGSTAENWITLSSADEGFLNGLTDGVNTLRFRSVDVVGNISETSDDCIIKIDTVKPEISGASLGDASVWKTLTVGSVLTIRKTDKTKIKLQISENRILSDVIVTIDGIPFEGTKTQLEDAEGNPTENWIWESSAEADFEYNKEIVISVSAVDAAGGTSVAEYKVLVDTEGPVIEITSPETDLEGDDSVSGDYTLRAGIIDAASEIVSTKYLITQTPFVSDTEAKNSAKSENSNWQLSSGKGRVNQKITLSDTTQNAYLVAQGKWYLYIYSIDDSGNDNVRVVSFWVDIAAPDLQISDAPENIYNKSSITGDYGSITISGSAADDNGIKEAVYIINNGSPKNLSYNSETHAWSLTETFGNSSNPENLADGDYTFAIKVTDNAERVSQKTYNIRIDTTEPQVTDFDVAEELSETGWYKSLVLNTDITAYDATSGVSFVQWSTDYNESTQNGNWTPLTYNESANKYSGPINGETSGSKTIYIKVTDGSNNTSISSFVKKLDAEAPSVSANVSGTTYVNGSAPMTFYGEVNDSASGVDAIILKIGESVIDADVTYSETQLPSSANAAMPEDFVALTDANRRNVKSWKAVVQGNKFVTGTLSVTAKDYAGNSSMAQQTANFVFDTKKPEINEATIKLTETSSSSSTKAYLDTSASGIVYYVNNDAGKTFSLRGVSSDDNGLTSTTFKIGDTSYTNAGSTTSWIFNLNNLNEYTGSSVTGKLLATDLAGNISEEKTIVIKFDRSAPELAGNISFDNKAYTSGMWGTSTALLLSGSLTENESGSAKITYKRYASSSVSGEPTTSGVITASANSFSGNITNLQEGDNYLILSVEDNVGNSRLLNEDPYFVKVDSQSPSIASTSGGKKFTNGKTDVTVTGTCSDDGSGIESVIVRLVIDGVTKSSEATVTGNTWQAIIEAEKLENVAHKGEYSIEATAKDVAGLTSSITVTTLQGDTNAPTVDFNSVTPSVKNDNLYIKPETALTVKGVTDDDLSTTVYTWIKLVPYKADGTKGSEELVYEDSDTEHTGTNSRSWTLTIPADKLVASDGYIGTKLYICTKDLAGNTKDYEEADLVFDTTGPEVPVLSKVSSENYSATDWYKNENLILSGSWTDAVGVSIVYYQVVNPKADGTAGNSTITSSNADNGTYLSFTPSGNNNGVYTFNTEIRGFANGTNTFIMYAKDALGNISASPWVGTIQVDTSLPEASEYTDNDNHEYAFTDSYLTNGNKGTKDTTLYFWAKDTGSGIATTVAPSITLDGSPLSYKASYSENETAEKGYLVTAVIKKESLTESGNKPVSVTITDKAGNESKINLGTIIVDRDDPKIELKAPQDADSETTEIEVNGTITIKGAVSDKHLNENVEIKFEYSSDNENWNELTTETFSNAADISITVDTTDTEKFTDKETCYIRATVEDKAGNTKTSEPVSFKVDQDTDRPVITFMDITVPDIEENDTEATLKLVNSKKLRLNITDDDGIKTVVTKLNGNEITSSSSNGTYIYDLSATDGTYPIEFTITDSNDGEFVSGTDKSPKFTDGSKKLTKASVNMSLMLDGTAPVVKKIEYAYYKGNYPADDTSLPWIEKLPALGGTREKLAIRIKAGDENSIAGISAKINDTYNAEKLDSDTLEDGKKYTTWIIKAIDVSESKLAEDGNYKMELTIKDGAANTKTDSIQLSVDRTPPQLGINTPNPVEGKATTYSSGSIKANGTIIGAKTLRYVVTKDGSNKPAAASYSSPIDFSTTWTIDFDGKTSETTGTHTKLLNAYLIDLYENINQDNLKNGTYVDVTPLYLWLKAEDEVGNVKEEKFPILVNPQGDRPAIEISYPQENGQIFGTAISIYGTHQDTIGDTSENIGVRSVWVQIISEAQGATITLENDEIKTFSVRKEDLDYMAEKGYEIYNMKTYKGDSSDKKWGVDISDKESGYNYSDYAALAKISGAAWNLTINSKGEFNPEAQSETGKNKVAIQVYAKDGDGKLNTLATNKYFYFDSQTPVIKDLMLVQEGTGVTRAYKKDMYISFKYGAWKLKGKASDSDGITKLTINGTDKEGIDSANPIPEEAIEYSLTKTGDVGTISFTIAAEDATHKGDEAGKEEISIKFDDKAPALITSGTGYNIEQVIRQNDGFYTFGSIAREEYINGTTQSGFAYTAFYFMRGNRLYDILKESSEVTLPVQYSGDDSMYWYERDFEISSGDELNELTFSNSDAAVIHKNSLIKIGKAYYLVTKTPELVNGKTKVTISEKLANASDTKAYITVAAVIDNTTKEKISNGSLQFDDGDNMLEYVNKQGSSWEWEASVCSKNISDGPVKLVYVVFDEAGNHVKETVDAVICNNTPRIAGFSIYTDYNANDEVGDEGKDGKYEEYLASAFSSGSITGQNASGKNVYDPDANVQDSSEKNPLKNKLEVYKGTKAAKEPVMTLRGKTKIVPEIVGGTGMVSVDYSINGKSNTSPINLFNGSTDYTIKSAEIEFSLDDLKSFEDIACTEFKFTFKDGMEDRNELDSYNLSASQKEETTSILSIYMGIAASASNPPEVTIDPFYWNSITDNSIYKSANATSYKDLRGHIELEDDWQKTKKYENNGAPVSEGEYDADPKVSGQIVVKGSVHDDNLIRELRLSFGSFINNIQLASFDGGALTVSGNVAESKYDTNGYWFTKNSETFSATGHDVTWTLYLNTEKVGLAATDVKLKITAKNNAKSGNGIYRMDIVPYITDVQTSLSSANKNNHSVYSRTALGHYPVYMTHEQGNTPNTFEQGIKVFGFNLKEGSITFEGESNNSSGLVFVPATETSNSYYTFNLPSGARKGNANVTVGTGDNKIYSLNNFNNDNAHGTYNNETIGISGNYEEYCNFYNRMPNKVNNNNLTDNVYFDVWDFNTQAAKAYGNGQLDNVVMKVSPTSGMIGFAFSNGSERFSMGGTNVEDDTEYSYLQWNRSFDYMQSTAFAYDSKGHSYATAAGGDINSSLKWDAFTFMTDRWTQPILGTGEFQNSSVNKQSNSAKQIEGIGQKGEAINPTGTGDKNFIKKDRFQSVSYATMRNKNDNGTYIYLAYYDLLNDEIRFKAGELMDSDPESEKIDLTENGKTTIGKNTNCYIGPAHDNFGNFIKSFEDKKYEDNAKLCQIVATNTTTGDYPQSSTLGSVGNAVAIGVTSDNVVVMVWYDGTDLKFSYNNEFAGYLTNTTQDKTFNERVKEAARVKTSKKGWTTAKTLISGAGEYCQLEVAADNSIHVVAYDSINSALKYAYLENYHYSTASTDTTVAKVCTVDSYLDTGSHLSLDVAAEVINETVRYIPHIGYWAAYPEKPRYAYLANPDTFFSAATDDGRSGSVQDKYTTVWECGVMPTTSSAKEGKINVGLWKATFTPQGSAVAIKGYRVNSNHFGTGTSEAATDKGKCYGNNSDNAVFAYVTTPSSSTHYIETAQMR